MTAPVTIMIPHYDMTIEVLAWLTLAPGLVVHAALDIDGWVVSHQRSGCAIALLADPESAQAIAVELGTLTDWTLSGNEVRAAGIAPAVFAIQERCLPLNCRVGEPIDRNEVSA